MKRAFPIPLSLISSLLLFLGASSFGPSAVFGPSAAAQQAGRNPFTQLQGLDNLQLSTLEEKENVTIEAAIRWQEGADVGRLEVTATIEDSWYVYSITQEPGGPKRTEIEIRDATAFEPTGPFVALQEPKRSESDVWKGLTVEKQFQKVTWAAPIRKTADVSPENVEAVVVVEGQVCSEAGSCIPFELKTVADFGGTYQAAKATGEYRGEAEHVRWQGWIEPPRVAPGEAATLVLRANPDESYHVYPLATSANETAQVTLIVLTQKAGLRAGAPKPSEAAVSHRVVPNTPPVVYHDGEITWRIPLHVPADAQLGARTISGMIGYQTCTDTSCDQPTGVEFTGTLHVSESSGALADDVNRVLLAFSPSTFKQVAESESLLSWVDRQVPETVGKPREAERHSLATILGLSLLGGLLLNIMPCVLPVIGLKVNSIVGSGGLRRGESLALNMAYAGGVLLVFWILAAIAVGVRVGSEEVFMWGEQFTHDPFQITLAVFCFAMALSLLGVWEIPIPGFAGGSRAAELQQKEGLSGSFFKGVFSTILATPCSGPGLGIAFAYAIGQPVWVTPVIFTSIGLGMSLPFLILAVSPGAARFLPKPGPWMDTFKQVLAFPLLGTVVWLFASISNVNRTPTLALLIGVWFACWLIGRVPGYAPLPRRITAWLSGIAVAALVGFATFTILVPKEGGMQWEDYSEARLAELQAEGRTVMLDFTADWCMNCIVNYNFAINTESVAEVIDRLDAVAMKADWSDQSPEIKRKLDELDSASIPLLAIYPGDAPEQPIVLRDLVTESQVLGALEQAGPSTPRVATASTPTAVVALNE